MRRFEASPRRATPKGQNLHQLHSTAIPRTHLHSPGSNVRGTPTQTRYPGTNLTLRYEIKTRP
jgi:hypothetical protein